VAVERAGEDQLAGPQVVPVALLRALEDQVGHDVDAREVQAAEPRERAVDAGRHRLDGLPRHRFPPGDDRRHHRQGVRDADPVAHQRCACESTRNRS
jgi:hypothetical protein